jgi:ABC-type branched-subunit amino acid transport system substrate-binding protein
VFSNSSREFGPSLAFRKSMNATAGRDSLHRRTFIRALVGGVCGIVVSPIAVLAAVADRPLTICLLVPRGELSSRYKSMVQGFDMSIDEAKRAATLFHRSIDDVRSPYDPASVRETIRAIKSKGAQVLVGGESDSDAELIADACSMNEIVYLNPMARSDALRRNNCSRYVFYVSASDAMFESARAQKPAQRVSSWDSSLIRYGASELNDRFVDRFKSPMTDDAWAGWLAVKIAWEAFLRSSGSAPRDIAAFLGNGAAQFDGHKGVALSFRSWDHQLRQPLYAMVDTVGSARPTVTDVPDLSRASGSTRQLLDAIGDGPATMRCVPAR